MTFLDDGSELWYFESQNFLIWMSCSIFLRVLLRTYFLSTIGHIIGFVKSYRPARTRRDDQIQLASALSAGSGKGNHQGPWCTYCKGQHPSVNNQLPKEEVQSLMKELHWTLLKHDFKPRLPICLWAPNPVSFLQQREQTSLSQGVVNILEMPEWCLIPPVKEATSQRTYGSLWQYLWLVRAHDWSRPSERLLPNSGNSVLFKFQWRQLLVCRCMFQHVYVVPVICGQISNQIIEFTQTNYPHFSASGSLIIPMVVKIWV